MSETSVQKNHGFTRKVRIAGVFCSANTEKNGAPPPCFVDCFTGNNHCVNRFLGIGVKLIC